MGLFGKKEFKVGQEFGKHLNRKLAIRKALAGYGKALRTSYLPRQDRLSIEEKMQGLKIELQKLKQEEQFFGMQQKVRATKVRIAKLKQGGSSSGQFLTDVPDVIGKMGGGKKSGGMGSFKIPKVI